MREIAKKCIEIGIIKRPIWTRNTNRRRNEISNYRDRQRFWKEGSLMPKTEMRVLHIAE